MPRPWHAGIIHDDDDRLALPLIAALQTISGLCVGINQPYAPKDRISLTLERHARPLGLECVMVEIRNDEIARPASQQESAGNAEHGACGHPICGTSPDGEFREPQTCLKQQTYVRWVDAINYRVGRFAMYLLFVLMAIMLWSSASKIAHLPANWTLETARFSLSPITFWAPPLDQDEQQFHMDLFMGASLRENRCSGTSSPSSH